MARDKRALGVAALARALARAEDAHSALDGDEFFAAVSETVWWLTTLDEACWPTSVNGYPYVEVRDAEEEGGGLLLGIRYARNRQVHDMDLTGMHLNPLLNPLSAREPVRWRSLTDEGVPPYTTAEGHWGKRGVKVYESRLARHEVLPTLYKPATFLSSWVEEMNRSRPNMIDADSGHESL